MLQIVPIPVADKDSTPGPKYSTIAPVPPLTVRMPATLRMTSIYQKEKKKTEGFGQPTKSKKLAKKKKCDC
jgi:hypothetical protein